MRKLFGRDKPPKPPPKAHEPDISGRSIGDPSHIPIYQQFHNPASDENPVRPQPVQQWATWRPDPPDHANEGRRKVVTNQDQRKPEEFADSSRAPASTNGTVSLYDPKASDGSRTHPRSAQSWATWIPDPFDRASEGRRKVVADQDQRNPEEFADSPRAPAFTSRTVSLYDHQAFAAKYMPDLGHEIKDFRVFTWRINNWSKLEMKLTSPEFDCGGHRWCILLFPFGNSNAPPKDVVSVYLNYANPKGAPEGWHVCAQFALVISNVNDPTIYVVSNAYHRFIAEECDWGFTHFSEVRKLMVAVNGVRPTIEGDAADISVFIRVLEDPTGVLWHNFVNYDSKKETGYVGLKNQGTDYMNVLLQSLFCTTSFRKAIYRIHTEDHRRTESVSLALQRVFYCLQTSDQAVETTELTKALDSKSFNSSIQRGSDAWDFRYFFRHWLEAEMKGTEVEGVIRNMFVGKLKNYIKCVNVDHESTRLEEFYGISLNIKGMKNLYESFKDYIAVETLDGEYKYSTKEFGLQDAKKGIIFQSFPPVLHLQLKRFDYDFQRDVMVKLNDRHEYPFELDLGEFLDQDADRSQPWIYRLHGVFVHSGGVDGGHYFALLKPDAKTRWLKFDRDRVTPVTDKEVLEENFGHSIDPMVTQWRETQAMDPKHFTNAYVLVYIRESKIDQVLAPIMDEDTPVHLKRHLDEERLQVEARKREREEQHLFLTVKVITDYTFMQHEGFDMATIDEKDWPQSDLPTFRVRKQENYAVFKARVAQDFQLPESSVRLWVMVNRQNKTVRSDTPIPENVPGLTVEVIRNNMAARQNDLRLYLDVVQDPYKPEIPQGYIMVFLKHFDTFKQSLYGIGKFYVNQSSKVSDLFAYINERMRWVPGTPLKLYEEIKPGLIKLMKPQLTFTQSEIQDGDIICFQVDLPEREIHDIESQGLYSNPIQYYDFIRNRVMILFRPKYEEPDQNNPDFSLVLSAKQNYDIMAEKVGEYLQHDPIKLRFTTTNPTNGAAKAVLKRSLNQSVGEITFPIYTAATMTMTVILYERLDISIVELETKRSLKVTWTGVQNKEESTHPFLLPKTNSVHDLAEHLSKLVTLTPGGTGRIRIFEISKDGKMQKEFTNSEMIGNIPEVELFAEEIPREEMEAADVDKIINAFHFSKEVTRTHGVPFKFVIRPNELFTETKRRLQARIGVSEKEFATFRFALIQAEMFKQPSYIEDEDVLYDHKFLHEDCLGLDHCSQVDLGENEIQDLDQVTILFQPKYKGPGQNDPNFSLVLSKEQTYDMMSQKVGEYLGHEPIKLRFTTTNPTTGEAKSALQPSPNQNVWEIMSPSHTTQTMVILYERLNVSLVELETSDFAPITRSASGPSVVVNLVESRSDAADAPSSLMSLLQQRPDLVLSAIQQINEKILDSTRTTIHQTQNTSQTGQSSFAVSGSHILPDDIVLNLLAGIAERVESAVSNEAPLHLPYIGSDLRDVVVAACGRDSLFGLKGDHAEFFVSIMQQWLFIYNTQDDLRRKVISVLVKLSVASGVLPKSLFIRGVDIGHDRDPIASGGFADVFQGHYQGQLVAIKRMRIPSENQATVHPLICREALLWRQLDHLHVLSFLGIDAEIFASRGSLGLISPWMANGTLKQYIWSSIYDISKDRDRLLYEVALGIRYLHGQRVVHGDIKWENIFVDSRGLAKVADLGVAIVIEATGGVTTQSTPKGTVAWMAPERVNADGPIFRLAPPMDVYSFGILCHAVWTRTRPFPKLNEFAIAMKVQKGQRPQRPTPEECDGVTFPEDLWQLVEACWAQDPSSRPMMSAVVATVRLRQVSGPVTRGLKGVRGPRPNQRQIPGA